MNYIVFDLEFNMFFKFKEGDTANSELKNEIIQIGAVKLNEGLETVSSFEKIIKPVVYRRISPYVRKKTNINTGRVRQGIPFVKAIESFCTWMGNDSVLCSWGHDDILGLRANCLFFGTDTLSFDKFIDIQHLYMKYRDFSQQPSLENAVEDLGIKVNAPFHDALSDAFYTVDVFRKVYDFSEDAIINWEKVREENEEKIKELRINLDKIDIHCPECNGYVKKDAEVTKLKKYFAFGYCSKCKVHIRHISRIIHREGMYSIISRNTIYKPDEAGTNIKQ